MNICLFISGLYGGGAERVTCDLANYLKRNNNVHIVVFSADKRSYILEKGISVHNLITVEEKNVMNRFSAILLRVLRLYKFLKSNEYDVIVSMLPVPIILSLCMKSVIKGKLIIAERCFPGAYPFVVKQLLRILIRRADGCVFQTKDIMRWYGKNINDCVIIPNAVNNAFYAKQFSEKREKKIVSVGRLEKQKNFELLINAFSLLGDEFDGYTLNIFGEGSERNKLTYVIKKLGLEGRVLLEGNVKNISEKICKATLFVLPSDYEGMPNALIEAMACGLPCISTDCLGGGARELIEHGENGYLIKRNDVMEMSECMKMLLFSEYTRLKIGAKAAKIKEQNNSRVIYSKWEKFFRKVCNINW